MRRRITTVLLLSALFLSLAQTALATVVNFH